MDRITLNLAETESGQFKCVIKGDVIAITPLVVQAMKYDEDIMYSFIGGVILYCRENNLPLYKMAEQFEQFQKKKKG
jgi:hypothetical protein